MPTWAWIVLVVAVIMIVVWILRSRRGGRTPGIYDDMIDFHPCDFHDSHCDWGDFFDGD